MTTTSEIQRAVEEGKAAYAEGRYDAAVGSFRAAAQGYAALRDPLNAAEQRNNLSVALLKLGEAEQALAAALGTDEMFEERGDVRRQGMALNNQAVALDNLGRADEALAAYKRSAELLREAGEGELRSIVLKAAASIQLRSGRLVDAATTMIGAVEARQRPSLLERFLRFLFRLLPR